MHLVQISFYLHKEKSKLNYHSQNFLCCNSLKDWFPNSNKHQNHFTFWSIEIAGIYPRVSDSVGLGWGLRICNGNKLTGNADTAFWGPHLENNCYKLYDVQVII